MSMENEKLNEGDVLKQAEDAAARIRARRAARGKVSESQAEEKAAGEKGAQEKVEIKFPELPIVEGIKIPAISDEEKKANLKLLGIEEEILANAMTPSAPEPVAPEQEPEKTPEQAAEPQIQAPSLTSLRKEPEEPEDFKKELTEEKKKEIGAELKTIRQENAVLARELDVLIQNTQKQEAEEKAREGAGETAEEKERREIMERFQKTKERYEVIKDSPKIPQELKNKIKKRIEEMERRLERPMKIN